VTCACDFGERAEFPAKFFPHMIAMFVVLEGDVNLRSKAYSTPKARTARILDLSSDQSSSPPDPSSSPPGPEPMDLDEIPASQQSYQSFQSYDSERQERELAEQRAEEGVGRNSPINIPPPAAKRQRGPLTPAPAEDEWTLDRCGSAVGLVRAGGIWWELLCVKRHTICCICASSRIHWCRMRV